jgi:hypothetical protein
LPENADAMEVYSLVQDQFIVGTGGPIALNQMTVHSAMELLAIEFREDCFRKVIGLGRHFIQKMKDAAR